VIVVAATGPQEARHRKLSLRRRWIMRHVAGVCQAVW